MNQEQMKKISGREQSFPSATRILLLPNIFRESVT